MTKSSSNDIQDRINEILQEIRIILPGTQALLGFQLVAFFNTSFQTLSKNLQLLHLFNAVLTTFCAILLITPVAYHEIKENGRNSRAWLKLTSTVMTSALILLLISLSGDVYVAATLISAEHALIPVVAALGTGLFGAFMWFGLVFLYKRN